MSLLQILLQKPNAMLRVFTLKKCIGWDNWKLAICIFYSEGHTYNYFAFSTDNTQKFGANITNSQYGSLDAEYCDTAYKKISDV